MTTTDWKTIFIRSAGFGAGLAITFIIGIATWSYFASLPKKPKPWNNSAINATFSDIQMFTGDRLPVTFKYILDNKTQFDYCLPSDNEAAFIRMPKTNSLTKDHELTWDKGTCVPTGQKVAVSFKLTYDYSDYSFPQSDKDNLEKLSKLVNRRLSEIDGFVILDNQHRYQINFPKGWDDKNSDKTTQ
ncbi:MAG: hypothetical protein Q8K68_09790 [Nitrospirota bacterium]|nr:hypothetical protein [Nitrospirota bacterium]